MERTVARDACSLARDAPELARVVPLGLTSQALARVGRDRISQVAYGSWLSRHVAHALASGGPTVYAPRARVVVVLFGRSSTALGRWQQDMIDRFQARGTMVVPGWMRVLLMGRGSRDT